jgi:HD-GYP domain-containing protein (c-di-GMP phosphodiesterase class II)
LRNSNRAIGNIPQEVTLKNEHSVWLRQQPYQSSLTVPLFDQNSFVGVLFYNASDVNHFDRLTQQGLYEYSQQVLQLVQGEWDYLNTLKIVHENIKHSAFTDAFDSIAHSTRVGLYSEVIANHLAAQGWLDDETLHHIAHCAALHDIGKYSVLSTQYDITWEPASDTTDNLKKSAKHGANVLNHYAHHYAHHYGHESHPSSHLLDQIIRYHHCYLDGSGYPRKETPPLAARIVTVANIFDALTSDRTYCQPWSVTHALLELEKKVSQGKIDSLCVDALRSQQQAIKSIMEGV